MSYGITAFLYLAAVTLFYFFVKYYFGFNFARLTLITCLILPKPTLTLLLADATLSIFLFVQILLVFGCLKIYERDKKLDAGLIILGVPFGVGCAYSPSFSFFFIGLWVLLLVSRSKLLLSLFSFSFLGGLLGAKLFSPGKSLFYPYFSSFNFRFENLSEKLGSLLLFGEATGWLHALALISYGLIILYALSILTIPGRKYHHCPSDAEKKGAPPSELFMIYLGCFFVFLLTSSVSDPLSNLTFYFNLILLICYGLSKMYDHHRHLLAQGPSLAYMVFLVLNILSYFKI